MPLPEPDVFHETCEYVEVVAVVRDPDDDAADVVLMVAHEDGENVTLLRFPPDAALPEAGSFLVRIVTVRTPT